MKKIILYLTFFSIISACKKDSILSYEKRSFTEYFPATTDSYIIYDCDSIVVDDFTGKTDTFKFQIKELYESSFIDNAGRNSIRLERWKKEADSSFWTLKDVWSLTKTDARVEKVEEDVRFIKLLFPPEDQLTWDINALNSVGNRMVEIQHLHQPLDSADFQFDSTLTVVNTDPANLVNEYRDKEVFAINKGMIYKKLVNVKYEVPTKKVKSGTIFTMRATKIYIKN